MQSLPLILENSRSKLSDFFDVCQETAGILLESFAIGLGVRFLPVRSLRLI